MKTKRLIAYIIDFFIVYFIATLIYQLPIFEKSFNEYQETSQEYLNYIYNLGSSPADKDLEIQYQYDISKSSQPLTIITCGLTILYFGVFAYLSNGQTLGKKITKIRVVSAASSKLNPNLFMLRAIILTNLIPKIASIISIAYLSKSNWFVAESIIGYISELVIFLIIGFMIFRDDERGLHDIICQTNVISTK